VLRVRQLRRFRPTPGPRPRAHRRQPEHACSRPSKRARLQRLVNGWRVISDDWSQGICPDCKDGVLGSEAASEEDESKSESELSPRGGRGRGRGLGSEEEQGGDSRLQSILAIAGAILPDDASLLKISILGSYRQGELPTNHHVVDHFVSLSDLGAAPWPKRGRCRV
jgi:hypothetical protein